MNIDLLSKMVLELIIEHDKVVLPFFGVFIAEVVPSSFSDKGYTLNPPYRRLHFRASSQSDNVLAEFYANANSVDLETAFRIVSDFTKELRNVLLRSKVLVFPGLGRIRTTKENNFFFVADEDLDIYPEGFGLKPISLKAHRAASLNNQSVEAYDNTETVSSVDVDKKVTEVAATEVTDDAPITGEAECVLADDAPVTGDVVRVVADDTPAIGEAECVVAGDAPATGDVVSVVADDVTVIGGDECVDVNTTSIADTEKNCDELGESVDESKMEESVVGVEMDESVVGTEMKESVDGAEPGKGVLEGEMSDDANVSAVEEDVKQLEAGKSDRGAHRGLKITIAVILGVIALVGLFLLVFLLLSELCPAFVDSLLYTEEELEILNYKY